MSRNRHCFDRRVSTHCSSCSPILFWNSPRCSQPRQARSERMQRVVLIQRVLPHYRISFAERLAARLDREAIDLRIVFGQERAAEVPASVTEVPDRTVRIRNRYIDIGPARLVWQPCVDALHGANMVVIEQSNALLLNYLLQTRLVGRGASLAYWGHGR